MIPLTIEQQIDRQIDKGCTSSKENIRKYLKTTSYYNVNYDYEPYILSDEECKFTIRDYKWIEEVNEKISKDVLSIILRSERIIRNRIADIYSFYCKDNDFQYFSLDSFTIDETDFPDAKTNSEKNSIKQTFIDQCWKTYNKKKSKLNDKYHFDEIEDVPPFVIAQHLSFGQIRTFFKFLHKSIKEKLVSDFYLKINEFNSLIEKSNYLRNACAHGDFILNFSASKVKRISNVKYHHYIYHENFILNRKNISLIPLLSMCAYILNDNLKFYKSTMRNILELSHYIKHGAINNELLLKNFGLLKSCKTIQKDFA